jgi:ATP phosphoribosyltransferase
MHFGCELANLIREQIEKNKADLDARKKKDHELKKKLSHEIAELVIKSGLLDLPITGEDLLKELKDCVVRLQKKTNEQPITNTSETVSNSTNSSTNTPV